MNYKHSKVNFKPAHNDGWVGFTIDGDATFTIGYIDEVIQELNKKSNVHQMLCRYGPGSQHEYYDWMIEIGLDKQQAILNKNIYMETLGG